MEGFELLLGKVVAIGCGLQVHLALFCAQKNFLGVACVAGHERLGVKQFGLDVGRTLAAIEVAKKAAFVEKLVAGKLAAPDPFVLFCPDPLVFRTRVVG